MNANQPTPAFVAARTSGFSTVTRPAGGRYCLEPNPAVLAQAFSGGQATRPAVASPDLDNSLNATNPVLQLLVRGSNSDCPANTFEVQTLLSGAATNDVSFTLIVP